MFTTKNNAIIFEYGGETLKIEAYGKNGLRLRSKLMGDLIDSDYALLPTEEISCSTETNGLVASITNGKIKAQIKVHHWTKKATVSFYNQKGELLLEEFGDNSSLSRHSRNFKAILGGNHQISVSFKSNKNEKLFGLGQYQEDTLNLKGCTFELAHRNTQASVPFVLSNLGYGFLWHNPSVGRVTFANNETTWLAENSKQVDYYICAGDTPKQILESYTSVTGRSPMMPEYGLGFWQCKLRYWNQEQLLEVAREYYKRKIPVDVIVCDFFHWPKMGDFRFEEEFFPNPEAMVKELADMGMELMVSVWPQVDLQSENFEEMKQKGYLIKSDKGVEISMRFGGESTFFDATNPKARKYVWEKCKQNYYDKGIKIFWLDEAEPEYTVYDFDNYRYHIGPNVEVGNVYPQMYSRTFYDGQKECGMENIINLVRCAWAGSQRYGALVWSGDISSTWEDFRTQIKAGLNMGLAGIPWWTTDIGGFHGGNPEDENFRELLVRWFQWGTFLPVMRLHGDRQPSGKPVYRKDKSISLFTGADNEIWSFGDENYPILKDFILLREKMRPYTRKLMEQAHENGSPVIRTLFYEFPNDEKAWEIEDSYMFGSDILVSPVTTANCTQKEVYLPNGKQWRHLFTNKIYEGGQCVAVDTPITNLPVFINTKCEFDI